MYTDLALMIPEIVLLTSACLILVIDSFQTATKNRVTFIACEIALALVATLILFDFPQQTSYAFNNTFISDAMSGSLKIIICLIVMLVFYYAEDYLSEHGWTKGEYFILGLFSVLGMMIMTSAGSLLTIYLGLELMSLSLYAMVAMHRDSPMASEAAMKYFIMGAIASGLLLYGISIIYGVTGSISLIEISQIIPAMENESILLTFGLIFIIAAMAFKLGAVPFHMWVPDVYQGAPTAVVLFIATAPKVAAFAMAVRLFGDGFFPLIDDWQPVFIALAIISIALGNIIAIAQTNIKRMLAYSTISHVGFLLLGLLSFDSIAAPDYSGFADAMFYAITYALMTLGVFGMIIILGRKDAEADELEDFRGLSERNPWFAFIMLIYMFSLAGVPPFVGFWAKLFVLKDVVQADLVWLAALSVFFTIIGAYYYLRVVKLIYFDQAKALTAIKASRTFRFIMSVNGLSILVLGIMPGALMSLCIWVFST